MQTAPQTVSVPDALALREMGRIDEAQDADPAAYHRDQGRVQVLIAPRPVVIHGPGAC